MRAFTLSVISGEITYLFDICVSQVNNLACPDKATCYQFPLFEIIKQKHTCTNNNVHIALHRFRLHLHIHVYDHNIFVDPKNETLPKDLARMNFI